VAVLANTLNFKVTLLRAAATANEFSAITGYRKQEGASGMHFQDFEGMARDAGNRAVDYLKGLESTLRKQGVANVDFRISHGSAAHVIVEAATEPPDNLVAMTTHGRSGTARWTLGSVTNRVVRHSGDPVLVIRND